MEEEIDKILMDNFKDGDYQNARKLLLELLNKCFHEPQYRVYNSETKIESCERCGQITN